MGKELEGWMEVESARKPAAAGDCGGLDHSLRARLWRWGAYMTKVGGGRSLSASWAREYIAYRDSVHKKLAIAHGLVDIEAVIDQMTRVVDAEQVAADAWVIENAWRRMGSFSSKQILLWRYVYGWDDYRIRSKLNIRGSSVNVPVMLARAEQELKKILDK